MFLRQALRHRLWQSCVLAGISLLITTCAAFGPWFARAVEQTVTTNALTESRFDTAWNVLARHQPRGETRDTVDPEKLDELLPATSPAVSSRSSTGCGRTSTGRPPRARSAPRARSPGGRTSASTSRSRGVAVRGT